MSKQNKLGLGLTLIAGALFIASAAQAEEQQSVYGALYNSANLVAENGGFNEESVLLFYPQAETEDEQGFIALTTNDNGIEWHIFDPLGLESTFLENNPLDEFNCRQPGRHSPIIYNGEYYFGASCQDGARLFKVTGIDSAEMIHLTPDDSGTPPPPPSLTADEPGPGDPPPPDDGPGEGDACNSQGYPTSAVVNDTLAMFYNCGVMLYDGVTATDYSTETEDALPGQPEGVTLEASDEVDGVVYLAFTDGSVWTFDGESYELLGQVEGVANLPAIGVNANGLYVGDMVGSPGPVSLPAEDEVDGAKIYKFNEETRTFDVVQILDSNNTIINKMSVDEDGNIIIFTANAENGSNVLAVDGEGNVWSLIDSGLGGVDPQNNAEVVSIAKKEVVDNGQTRYVMAFGTKNQTDQTKIFVLNLGDDLAVDVTNKLVLLPPTNDEEQVAPTVQSKKKTLRLKAGQLLKVKVPKKRVRSGDVFSLLVNDEVVATKTASKKARIILKYKKTKKYSGTTIDVGVGVKRAYGDQVSENTIAGGTVKVKVTRKKKS